MAERRGGTQRGGRGGAGGSGPHLGRRAALIGGGLAVLGAAGLARDELARLLGGRPSRPRKAGEVDFRGARWIEASPANRRLADRPADYRVDLVVVHVTQGGLRSAVKVFRDPAHGAAAHYIVARDGAVTQMVRELDVGFHAGNREYNNRSIGIEHEGWVDRRSSFTDAMYAASARLTAGICERYGIPVDRRHIIGHVEVPGADHTDPGPYWDWDRYLKLVRRAGTAGRDDRDERGKREEG
ncbi:N-acetylmuramoyl-L-alanine amidase [Streptomyces sp. NPDC058045]|uniref:N-acetylmuramoyl-L-alanine amidase n=1 Tax=Streptomyces sp. NPDC058045 TaxID=3346311 RepID=UPI0036E791CA